MRHIHEMTRRQHTPQLAQGLDSKFAFLFDFIALLTDSTNLIAAIQSIIPGKVPDDS